VRQTLSRGADDAATVGVMEELATCMREVGNIPGAQRVHAEATAMLRRLGQERTMLNVRLLSNRGRTEMKLGRPGEAIPFFDAALALAREHQATRGSVVAGLLRK
jgi:hypothetical protein